VGRREAQRVGRREAQRGAESGTQRGAESRTQRGVEEITIFFGYEELRMRFFADLTTLTGGIY